MSIHLDEESDIHQILSRIYLPLRKKIEKPMGKDRVIVIAGPTATGKTQLSLAIAHAIGGEIVSADSMQIYRGMNIGTAKATQQERELVPHHLIDVCDLSDPFNVVDFFSLADQACKDILQRGKVPIVTGGAGFYLHSFLYGPPLGPDSVPYLREQLEAQMEEMGASTLYERLQMLDPEYASTITENDRHKIIRALEIISITKRKVSSIPKREEVRKGEYDFRCWFVYFPREQLYPRIEKRCDVMVEQGLVEEVKELQKQGLEENRSACQAIGYRQCLEFLHTQKTQRDWEFFLTSFKKASRHYAKRQFTWFQKEPYFRWLNLNEIDFDRVRELILQDYEQGD